MLRVLRFMLGGLVLAAFSAHAFAQAGPGGQSLGCRAEPRVKFSMPTSEKLDQWCGTVGPPALNIRNPNPAALKRLAVVSWNVHVGGGHLEELVAAVRKIDGLGESEAGLVLLLQEAFRAMPMPTVPAGVKVPSAIRPRRPAPDVMESASRLGLSVVYVPSMRNGREVQEDRGNAVLSSEPLRDLEALELPFGSQRRVAVAATVTPRGGAQRPIRFVSLHFDTGGSRKKQASALAAALPGPVPVIASGDLNAVWRRWDGAYRVMRGTLPEVFCGNAPTFGWFFRLDFVFGNPAQAGWKSQCSTMKSRFDSDHRPILLQLELP